MAINKDAILEHIRNNNDFLKTNENLFDILEGDLLSKVDAVLRDQLLSDKAYAAARRRIPSINIIKKIIDKLSKIYATPISRTAENPVDQEIMDFYVKEMQVDTYMGDSTRFFNSMRNSLLDPFLDEGMPRLRVTPSHQFLPFSDDPINPQKMTHLVVFMGKLGNGKAFFFVYSAEEFIAFDESGTTLPKFMVDNLGVNPFGVIPHTYVNKSRHLLIPKADKDLLQMGILIPLILADLNFAVEYQSHSIMYGIDINADNLELNPNAFWNLKSDGEGKPEIGQIKPEVDINNVIDLVNFLIDQWLESRNIRPKTGRVSSDSAASGHALVIKEIDTTDDRKEQIRYYQEVEKIFWHKIKIIHNKWVDSAMVKGETRKFSETFDPLIVFPKPVVIETQGEVIKRHKELFDLDLTTKRLALREIYPDKSSEDIQIMLDDIDDEGELSGLAAFQPESKQDVQ